MASELPANTRRGTVTQFFAALTGAMAAISEGMHLGWSSPIIPILLSDSTPVKITEDDIVWIEIVYLMGSVGAFPVTTLVLNKIGCKKTILVGAFSSLTAWVLIAIAHRIEIIYFARVCTGVGSNMTYVAAPMYIAEISYQRIRGSLGGLVGFMGLVGILIIYTIGPFLEVYQSAMFGGFIVMVELIIFPFMPQSPYYLVLKGKIDEAAMVLGRLRSSPSINNELQHIKMATDRQNQEGGKPQDLLLVSSNLKALIIMLMLNAAQHFSGYSALLMNVHLILEQAESIYFKPSSGAIWFAAIMLIAAILFIFVIDVWGRVPLLVVSSILTGISIFTLAIYFHLQYLGYHMQTVSWIPEICVVAFAFVFKFGLGMVPIVMTAEIFPLKLKAFGMTLSDNTYVLFSLVSVYLYHLLSRKFGKHVAFYFFSTSSFLMVLFTLYFIPETKGRSLEEVQFILKGLDIEKASEEES